MESDNLQEWMRNQIQRIQQTLHPYQKGTHATGRKKPSLYELEDHSMRLPQHIKKKV
jgi:hypothetical protein